VSKSRTLYFNKADEQYSPEARTLRGQYESTEARLNQAAQYSPFPFAMKVRAICGFHLESSISTQFL
jgi:hypothetical protein